MSAALPREHRRDRAVVPLAAPAPPALAHVAPTRANVSDLPDEDLLTASAGDEATLTDAGWHLASHPGWWIDPATGREVPAWRALSMAKRDSAPINPGALR